MNIDTLKSFENVALFCTFIGFAVARMSGHMSYFPFSLGYLILGMNTRPPDSTELACGLYPAERLSFLHPVLAAGARQRFGHLLLLSSCLLIRTM